MEKSKLEPVFSTRGKDRLYIFFQELGSNLVCPLASWDFVLDGNIFTVWVYILKLT